jgi:O-acetyl-ADP-ribose deacetylase (regulator of RNase III)
MSGRLTVVKGDITKLDVDAVVNAANRALAPGAGVDGAIRRAAGPDINRATAAIGGCATGEARITNGFDLPAKWVIHTVGPVWSGGSAGEPELLASCYRSSLALAAEHGARRIAFPAISTGIYGFPSEQAAAIAVREVRAFLGASDRIDEVILVAFGAGDHAVLENAAKAD